MNKELISSLGLGTLLKEDQEKIIKDINEKIHELVFYESINELNDDKFLEFDEVLKKNNSDEINNFFYNNIQNYEDVIKKITEDFARDLKKELIK